MGKCFILNKQNIMEDQLKEIFFKTEIDNIIIVPNLTSKKDALFASLALFNILKKLKKNVNLLLKEDPNKYSIFFENLPLCFYSNFLISFVPENNKEAKIYYEKEENEIKLYLTNTNPVNKEFVKIATLQDANIIFALGFQTFNELECFLKEYYLNLENKIIINIDNQILNENFGKINLVDINSSSISEIVFDFLKEFLPSTFKKDVANTLLAGILNSLDFLKSNKYSSNTLEKVIYLKNLADFENVVSFLTKTTLSNEDKLLLKTIEKSEFVPEKKIILANLLPQDFSDLFFNKNDLKYILEKFTLQGSLKSNFLFLLEKNSPLFKKVIFYSPNVSLNNKVSSLMQGSQKQNWVLIDNPKESFEEIKSKFLNLI